MIAYKQYKEIEKLTGVIEKHRAWLEAYKGKKFSKALNGVDLIKWKNTKYEAFDVDINKVGELGNRLRIEFDGEEKKAKEDLDRTEEKLKKLGWGYIRSTHKGKSDYLWIEFTRDLTTNEKKNFLKWIAPNNSTIDMNFSSPNFCFPVLYALHWKHSDFRELPVSYFEGKQIDYDKLNIGNIPFRTEKVNGYETYTKEDNALKVKTFLDYKNLKKPKNDLIQGIIPQKSLSLTYAPPKNLKSLIELDKCICLASGRKFLNLFKTKKTNCLYIDLENNEYIIKERWEKLRKFHNVRSTKGLYYLSRESPIDILNPLFVADLEALIKKYKIGYMVIDTLPKSANYDTYSEQAVNSLYTYFFKPLILKHSLSINFLLHTNKAGKSFIGSQAYLGIVDCSYEITKERNTTRAKVISDNRGENIEFGVEFNFTEEDIKTFSYDVEREKPMPIGKLKEITAKVKSYFKTGTRLGRKDIEIRLQSENFDYSKSTLTRVLKFLVESEQLDRDDKGVYWLK